MPDLYGPGHDGAISAPPATGRPGRVLTMLRNRGLITAVAILALAGLLAALVAYLAPLVFAGTA